jgi:pSer/pThr/pTyr-binding forkhead associated (FHA) protein
MSARVGITRDVTEPVLVFPNGARYPLQEDIRIGRDAANDLVLPSKSISREHAVITRVNRRWFVEDRGSFNGTLLNGARIQPGSLLPLRHGDRVTIGRLTVVYSDPAAGADDEITEPQEEFAQAYSRPLSPLQLRVVRCLCAGRLVHGVHERLPSNEEIAAELGTPGATDAVKAALRRAYVKAGVSDLPPHEKRRALCRIARQRGWL